MSAGANIPRSHYDAAVLGGGLAGLVHAILLAQAGFRVVLIEKEAYPFHRVCGEYISMESWDFLESLGIPLSGMDLPRINRLQISDPDGRTLDSPLPLGGFGISRYKLDDMLAEIARSHGVELFERTKVIDARYTDGRFDIELSSGTCTATHAFGAFGKRSSLDIRWDRAFTHRKPGKLSNHVAVKYHVRMDMPRDLIVLHNFENGYCGMSAIEDGKYCLCYIATAADLSRCGNSIPRLEKEWLGRNPILADVFRTAEFLYEQPVTISQISFNRKSQVEGHVLLAGDAAGMITPLCGNGMSMALRGAKLAANAAIPFLQWTISREQMEKAYRREWDAAFATRLRAGRTLQSMFGKPALTRILLDGMRPFPRAVKTLIGLTHGKSF